MITINEHYGKLRSSYLFTEIAKRVRAFQAACPDKELIRLGIGDVTRPLPPAVIEAMRAAAAEMADASTFRGYGPEQGYDFLREAIAAGDFRARGVDIKSDEIFVSDGSKCDTGNFQELFAQSTRVAVADPVYPVYVDTNVMAGRTGAFAEGRYQGLHYLVGTPENGFVPPPPSEAVDLIYLCFPNNPTGATATREQLAAYVEYARANRALILFDAAYEAFIRNPNLPHSIYEIPGATECAVEFRSFSKTAGFTGVRCAYTVVPHALRVWDHAGGEHSLHALWTRRHTTKFNGVSYPVQRAAAAVYSADGQAQTRELIDYYLGNAAVIRAGMAKLGYWFTGGEDSPYVWIKTDGSSWDFFDRLLNDAGVVVTPGAGFGAAGEGFIRISAFNERHRVEHAMERIRAVLG